MTSTAGERGAVDRETFVREILPAHRPVVLRGQADGWPVVAAARAGRGPLAAYLAGKDGGGEVDSFVGAPEIGGRFFYRPDLRGFNFERRRLRLAALLEELGRHAEDPAPPALYAGAALADAALPGFAAENPMPLLPAEVPARVWIGNAVTVSTHFDLGSNVAVAVGGRRRFTLFPPEAAADLYVGPLEHTLAGQPVSMVDLDAPDLVRHPRFPRALAQAQVAELEPGDALFIPSLWWHHVRAFAPLSVLVNYWWGQAADASPFEALIHALLAVRDRPEGERQAWRALFAHFVFDADPADRDHLPPHARGVLGPPSEARSALIRNFLLGSLSRR